MELDLTTEQRKFRDELRGVFADMMTGGWGRAVAPSFAKR